MSEAHTIGAIAGGRANVRAAIARASEKTGVDFQYLLAQAKLESSLDPNAKAKTSSAAGLYQFTRGTWLETLDRHSDNHGLAWAGDAISGGRISNAHMAGQIMALRYDADVSALMAAELARDNGAQLEAMLGRKPDAAELYLGHFLGAGGAGRFLKELAANPERSAASLLPKAAAANRTIFYERSGASRSVAGVMELMRDKMASAMEAGGTAWAIDDGAVTDPSGRFADAPITREFHAARAQLPPPVVSPPRSMAETLQSTFGTIAGNGPGGTPAFVRAAYEKLARFGL